VQVLQKQLKELNNGSYVYEAGSHSVIGENRVIVSMSENAM